MWALLKEWYKLRFQTRPVMFEMLLPVDRLNEAFRRIHNGEFGCYQSNMTVEDLQHWQYELLTPNPTARVALEFGKRGHAMRFKLAFA